MPRKSGPPGQIVVLTTQTAAIGDSDGDNIINMAVPGDNAWLIDVSYGTTVVGATTGTFTATLEAGIGSGGAAIAVAATIDADAATDTIVKADGLGRLADADVAGTGLQILTAKSGTVSTGTTLAVTTRWYL